MTPTRSRVVPGLLSLLAVASAAVGQSAPVPLPPVNAPPPAVNPDTFHSNAVVLPGDGVALPPSGGGCDPLLDALPTRERVEFFPTSLLWEPKLADKRDPRFSVVFNDVDSYFSNRTVDPSLGLTAGVVRLRPQWFPNTEWQVDVFGVAHLRFSRFDESIAQDYRAGVPVTVRVGNVVGKLGYEHTSTQLGDELGESGRRVRRTYERDELVGALGYLWENQLRVYGQAGYAFYRTIPGDPERWRYDAGFDWYKRQSTGPRGQPFAAVNAAFDPAVDYRVTMNYQVGWMWKIADRRLSQFRVYAEFFDGHSVFGQLFDTRERYAGVGISLDY